MKFWKWTVSKLKYWLLALFFMPIFSAWTCSAVNDLLKQVTDPADDIWITIHIWDNVGRVWKSFFEGRTEASADREWIWVRKTPSIIVKVTRLLLSLVVALSVTMILYNWLTYIIQTWQWKEWKDLVKNVIYIVIWIIVSLFSVTIITVLQSVSTTLDKETKIDWSRDADNNVVYNEERKWINWSNLFNKTK